MNNSQFKALLLRITDNSCLLKPIEPDYPKVWLPLNQVVLHKLTDTKVAVTLPRWLVYNPTKGVELRH